MPITTQDQVKDATAAIYDNFYNIDIQPSAAQYEIVNSFFNAYTSDQLTSESFTTNLFRISQLTGVDALELLETFKGANDPLRVSLTMAYYLNTLNPNKVVLYGVRNVITPIESVQRNILQ